MKRVISFILAAVILSSNVFAVKAEQLENIINETWQNMYNTVSEPVVGSIGGEWAVIGLARGNKKADQSYYDRYYDNVQKYVKECSGILHTKKYTEYSRVILGLTAIGKNPQDVGGYNLLEPLGDFEKTILQGLNGPVWALIALDSKNYSIPVNKSARIQATREMYVNEIISRQNTDGGFSLSRNSTTSDPDITGMALTALSNYTDNPKVKESTERAVGFLSSVQNGQGGFKETNAASSESTVQVIVGLSALNIRYDDERFTKNGKNLLDNLLSFYTEKGKFLHTYNGDGENQMATEQALYALDAIYRMNEGKAKLFDMKDVKLSYASSGNTYDKHEDVKINGIIYPSKSFSDIKGHKNEKAIKELATRGIINGKSEDIFDPDATMTRMEFATMVVKALGLKPKENNRFSDVESGKWFSPYIGTGADYGIITGIGDNRFNPNGTITKQEASAMVMRMAKLCGMNTESTEREISDMLAQFADYVVCADWARPSLAFCYKENILNQSDMDIKPTAQILRGEMAEMLYRVLAGAKLI